MKESHMWAIILIVIVVALTFGSELRAGLRDGDILDLSWLFGEGTGKVAVDKLLDFSLHDKYGGSALGSKSLKIYNTNDALIESLTTGADGTIATTDTYPSGTQLFVYYESTNDKQWFNVVVPEMNPDDAEASAYNVIKLDTFAIGTYTASTMDLSNGTNVADAGTYDISLSTDYGNTPVWTYGVVNTGSDNTGLMSSFDPVYDMAFDVVVYMTFSGTGYESVLVYGDFDYDFTLGTTRYLGKRLDPYALTRHKVGWKYESMGTSEVNFWMDLSGITTGDSVTWQTYIYAYSDGSWCQNHGGDFGYEKVELDEVTITIQP